MFDFIKKNYFAYLLYFAILIEIIFVLYFSFTTKNIVQYIFSLILIILFTFPLGISTSILLFREKTLSEITVLSICAGLPLTAGVWGVLSYSSIPFHPSIYLGSIFLISIILLLITKIKYKKILCQENINYKEICLPVIVFIVGFLWHALMQANNNVPFDCDAQSANYIEILMKYQGYPAVYPFLSNEIVNIAYPPTFHTLVVLTSIMKNSAILKECMAITVICGSYFVLAVYLLAYYLSQKNYLIAFFAGILTLNRAYLTNYNDGNTTEMLAFLCVAVFLIFLLHAFEESHWIKTFALASIAGFTFSHAALSQTEIFQWYLISLIFFLITFLISKRIHYKKDYLVFLISMFACGICVLPWFFNSINNFDKNALDKLSDKEATELILSLTLWHSYVFLGLSMIGLIILIYQRNKIGIFMVTHVMVMFLLIIHWRFLKLMGFDWFQLKPLQGNYLGARAFFTSPIKFLYNYTIAWYSLTIAFPIAASYCLDFLNNLLKKIKIFQFRTFCITPLFIAIGISVFMYYEYKSYCRYPEWLLKTDYETLLWFHENTSYKNTLILNPPDPITLSNGVQFYCSYWVPAISERRAVNSRGLGGDHIPITQDLAEKIKQLGNTFYNIQTPNAYEMLKNNGISHIFVSTLLASQLLDSYLKTSFLELVYYKSITEQGTAFIFKVK